MIHAVTADLFFRAKIEETARAIGAPAPRFKPTADAIAESASTDEQAIVLLELGPRTGGVDAIATIRAKAPNAKIVAFGSHVDTETLQKARDLGASEVMARSAFVKEMPRLLGGKA